MPISIIGKLFQKVIVSGMKNQPVFLNGLVRLKVLHINDNRGEWDDHIVPYFGTIEWVPIMKTLEEI